MPVPCCRRVWYLGLVPSVSAHPVIVRPGPARLQQEPVQPHHTGFGLSSHQHGGLDVSLSPSSTSQLRSSVVRGRKWVQLPDTSATSLLPAWAQPGVANGRWSRHSLLLMVLWFLISFPIEKKIQNKKKNQQKPSRKVDSRACSSLCPGAWGCLHQAVPLYRPKPTTELRGLNPSGQKS